MPTVFDAHFASAGFPMLLEQFGEPIVYLPSGGGRRSITAIVERNPPSVFDASGNAVLPTATIRIYNSCRSGISSKEVNTGTDEIEMVLKVGDTIPKRFSLMTLLAQDSGVTYLAVI
jgi:hypothetical protein